ncbi:MAG: TonB family protein [Chitinivibrionales bacterium]|nr:TonB family protein [Chitinivibrionales bacterium]
MSTPKKNTIPEYYTRKQLSDYVFSAVLPCIMAVLIGGGLLMKDVKPEKNPVAKVVQQFRTQFVMDAPKKIEPVKPVVKPIEKKEEKAETPVEKKVEEKPVDLTEKPLMGQKQEDIQPQQQEQSDASAKPVRRVFGLRKVYSTGLGAGGAMTDAVIGKLGNTVNKDFDTVTATQQEIKGSVVSATTVTQAPSFKKRVVPEYTKEMLDNRIEGTINVKILVDIDGRVKKAQVLNDLGYNAGQQALDAILKMEFFPALRGSEPVAVWIIIPVRFVMLG